MEERDVTRVKGVKEVKDGSEERKVVKGGREGMQ